MVLRPILIKNSVPFIFVVCQGFSNPNPHNLRVKDIVEFGEKISGSSVALQSVNIQGFFPNLNSVFYSILNPLPPINCCEFLEKEQELGTSFKLVIPGWKNTLLCKIENMDFDVNEQTGDIYYNITLKEDRENKSRNIDRETGLLERGGS